MIGFMLTIKSINMHPMVYLMLLAGPCLAHYRFEPRNLVEREEQRENGEWVDCPVCETPSYSPLLNREVCERHEGRSMKFCRYGTYINEVCGSRRDCYRGPGESCTEKLEYDAFGQACAPGWTCSASTGKCTGLGNHYRDGQLRFLNSERYPLSARRGI